MKTFQITLTFVIALLINTTSFANAPADPTKSIRRTIATWLQAPDLQQRGIQQTTVHLSFSVNERNELQIREIDTDREFLIPFILERLQGKKIKTKVTNPEAVYNITVSFVAEE